MNAKVAISFLLKEADATLVVSSGRIVNSMTGNASFPAPAPALATITTARNGFMVAVSASDRGAPSVALRKQLRAQLCQLLRDLALYVQHTCQGDGLKLLSSGFPAQKGRTGPVGVLGPPLNLRLTRTKIGGQILARCNAMPTARSYQWRYANAQAPTVWTQSDATTAASYLMQNLTPTAEYLVQARVLGALGPSNWSGSASLVAL